MSRIHDDAVREEIKRRIMALTPDSQRQWGRMTPDQMLWHCAEAIDTGLGNKPYKELGFPKFFPKALVRWSLLKGPWPKGRTPTAPQWVAKDRYDFGEQRTRLLGLVDALAEKDPGSNAARHPILGEIQIEFQSQLHARHLNHHLTQFGV
jgi:hypothetical protein